MKLILASIVVLLVSVGYFLTAGISSMEQGRQAAEELSLRASKIRTRRNDTPVVSHDEVKVLSSARDAWGDLSDQWLGRMTDPELKGDSPDLEPLLKHGGIDSLRPGSALYDLIIAQSRDSEQTQKFLSRIVGRLIANEISVVENFQLEGLDDEKAQAATHPDFMELRAHIIVTSTLDRVLAFLESLTPDKTRPLISVQQATLRRFDPDQWAVDLLRLDSPPIRLSVTIVGSFPRDASEGES